MGALHVLEAGWSARDQLRARRVVVPRLDQGGEAELHVGDPASAEQEQLVALLRECIMIRDNVFTLPNFYTVADVRCIISSVCSSG